MAGGCVVSVNTGKSKATMLAQMCGRWRGLSAAGNQQSLGESAKAALTSTSVVMAARVVLMKG